VEVVEHQGTSLRYLTVLPDDFHPDVTYPLIVMLHGFGAGMRDLAGLASVIARRGYVYACPNAPLEVSVGPGMVGYGWTPPGERRTPQDLQRAEEMLEAFYVEVLEQYHTQPGGALLMGFSQGGGMTYRTGLGNPQRFAGLAALSAARAGVEELDSRLPATRSQPIFIGHGLTDPLISVDRAREARDYLVTAGYSPYYREYPMAHEISQQELDDLVPWIHQTLPPTP
jgi:phospholipase/carboxylesterase